MFKAIIKKVAVKTKRIVTEPLFQYTLFLGVFGVTLPAMAGGVPFLDNFNTLLNTLSGYSTILAPTGGGLMIAYHAIMRNLNDDPQSVSHHTGSMKKVGIGTAIATGASGLTNVITGAFGGGSTTGMLPVHSNTAVAMLHIATKVIGA